jgi:hypothetical protein
MSHCVRRMSTCLGLWYVFASPYGFLRLPSPAHHTHHTLTLARGAERTFLPPREVFLRPPPHDAGPPARPRPTDAFTAPRGWLPRTGCCTRAADGWDETRDCVHDGRQLACARQVRTASPVATQQLFLVPNHQSAAFTFAASQPWRRSFSCLAPARPWRVVSHIAADCWSTEGLASYGRPTFTTSASPLKQHILLLPTQYSDMPLRVNLYPPLLSRTPSLQHERTNSLSSSSTIP